MAWVIATRGAFGGPDLASPDESRHRRRLLAGARRCKRHCSHSSVDAPVIEVALVTSLLSVLVFLVLRARRTSVDDGGVLPMSWRDRLNFTLEPLSPERYFELQRSPAPRAREAPLASTAENSLPGGANRRLRFTRGQIRDCATPLTLLRVEPVTG